MESKLKSLNKEELAQLGNGQIAYIKQLSADEIICFFPSISYLDPGVCVWGLFGANGDPVAVSDRKEDLFHSAREQSLKTIPLH